MPTFDEVIKRHLEKLQLFVPIVASPCPWRRNHPEFNDVHKLFDEIIAKLRKQDQENRIWMVN